VDGTPKATLTVPEAKCGAVTEHRAIETLLFLPEKARVLAALALDATVYFWRLIDQELVYTSAPSPSALRCISSCIHFLQHLRCLSCDTWPDGRGPT
jgi:hypothetical protein